MTTTTTTVTKGDLPGELFDLLVDATDGLTIDQMIKLTGAPQDRVRKAIRTMRLVLSEGEEETLFVTADPQGMREGWIYKLVDGSALVDAEKSRWTANRVKDAQSRINLLQKGMVVAVRATDARTVLGRKAVTIERQLRHLLEDLEAVEAG